MAAEGARTLPFFDWAWKIAEPGTSRLAQFFSLS
jgi:hypothetical protein